MSTFFTKVVGFIKGALSSEGQPSSMRLMAFIGFIQWSLAITFGFIYVLFTHTELIISYLWPVITITGAIIGLKVTQAKIENQPDSPKG